MSSALKHIMIGGKWESFKPVFDSPVLFATLLSIASDQDGMGEIATAARVVLEDTTSVKLWRDTFNSMKSL